MTQMNLIRMDSSRGRMRQGVVYCGVSLVGLVGDVM